MTVRSTVSLLRLCGCGWLLWLAGWLAGCYRLYRINYLIDYIKRQREEMSVTEARKRNTQ